MEYVTSRGLRLEVGRVPRERIDAFNIEHPPPEPPTREVETFGGIMEDVPVLDDPGYMRAMYDYYIDAGRAQIELVADAVEVSDLERYQSELQELRTIGIVDGDEDGKAALLYHVLLNDAELADVVELVLYQSTVTQRGIREAEEAFSVTWAGKPVTAWRVPGTPGRVGRLFEDRQAARLNGYTWRDFRRLPGPEQSACVALIRIGNRLEWLRQQ